MKNEKKNSKELLLICVGLLFATSSVLVNDWVRLPDFFRGFLVGLGLCLECGGIILMLKRRRKVNQNGA